MLKPILRLTGVNKAFSIGGQQISVLKDINLTLHAGAMVAIVGASGSGKSTLMNILGCLDQPSSGSYHVGGRDTRSLDSDQLARLRRQHFGFIFQRYHLLPNLTARENVEIPAIYAGTPGTERQETTTRLLARLGLSDRAGHRPSQLSGGQQQRVSIARALMNGGMIILADEPTGALDTDTGRETLQILLELQAEGHTVVIVTHDMNVAAYCERIIELRDGVIVADRPNRRDALRATMPELTPNPLRSGRRRSSPSSFKLMFEAMRMAWLALLSHRLRTALTMLGIVIGISSVVSIMAIGEGQRVHMQETIGFLTSNLIEIHRGTGWGDAQATAVHTLVPGDLETLRSLPYVDSVSPFTRASLTVRYQGTDASGLISGVGEDFFRVRGIVVSEGRAFGRDDVQRQSQVVVLSQETRRKFFAPGEDPIGKVVIVGNVPCKVIGVASEASQSLFPSDGLNLLLPYTTAGVRLFGQQYFDSMTLRLTEKQNNQLVEKDITSLLMYKHGIKDFFINNMDALAKAYEKTTESVALMLSLIAAIALMVGGIGVMNIMLVSVTERTREIGIRMAVGARRADIMKQFLAEAVVICLIGGMFGVLVSAAAGMLFDAFVKEWRMVFTPGSMMAAFFCSTLIGLFFGFMPARKAARLSPIEALTRD